MEKSKINIAKLIISFIPSWIYEEIFYYFILDMCYFGFYVRRNIFFIFTFYADELPATITIFIISLFIKGKDRDR